MPKENNKEPAQPDVDKAPPAKLIKAGVVPEMLMQQLTDALRDHVPHKVADPLLHQVRTIQYGNFPVGPAVKPPE